MKDRKRSKIEKARSKARWATKKREVQLEECVKSAINGMESLYECLPNTKGCENCSEFYGTERQQWCCKEMVPDLWYAEFALLWNEVLRWPRQQREALLMRSLIQVTKRPPEYCGCPFFNGGCEIYKYRPMTCRQFGSQTSECFKLICENEDQEKGRIGVSEECDKLVVSGDRITTAAHKKMCIDAIKLHLPMKGLIPPRRVYYDILDSIFAELGCFDQVRSLIQKNRAADEIFIRIVNLLP
jgi:hypothetical protein